MARHTGGWVKFWRKAALGDINSNFTRGGLFGALIAMANIQESTVAWGGKPRKLVRGQICTSLRELSDLGGVDPKTVSRHLAYLQLRDTINVEKCSTGTIITFVNYEEYAGLDATGSTRPPHGMDNDVHAIGIHNEERKNKRNKEDVALEEEFKKFESHYRSVFPGTTTGQNAKSRFVAQFKDKPEELSRLWTSVGNYRSMLSTEDWRKPKQSVETYLGTKKSYFWRDFIEVPTQAQASGSMRGA